QSTQSRLRIEGDELVSTVNGTRYGIGQLSMPTLAELRARVNPDRGQRSSARILTGDVGPLHSKLEFEGALFQVASQFNLLEMPSQNVTPEAGVTKYVDDPTQGPACAMAAAAGSIYRNYFAPVGEGIGQTRDRQLDALAGLGAALSELTGLPASTLWNMQNGYALGTGEGLAAIGALLDTASEDVLDTLRGELAIGLHRDVEVTDGSGRRVSQAYCSALPIGYSSHSSRSWEPFARLVLQASYEAVMLAAAEQASAGGSNTVLLTRIGGGVFGNGDDWIDSAIERAMDIVKDAGLDIVIVEYRGISPGVQRIVENYGG
ncbi:MAG: hypothetical protein ACR2JI_17630, partial [Mycobacterium sp.]